MYAPGQSFTRSFTTQTVGGNQQDADSLPTAKFRRNGNNDLTPVLTVTKIATGDYKVAGTIPSTYNFSDDVEVIVNGVVGGIPGENIIALGPLGGNNLDIDMSATSVNS